MDMNQTCVVVGEFGFSFRIVTVSTICEFITIPNSVRID